MWKFIVRLFGGKVTSKKKDKFFIGTVTSKEEGFKGLGSAVTLFEIAVDGGLIHRAATDGHGFPINRGDRVEMSLSDKSCTNIPTTESVEGEGGRTKIVNTRIYYYQIDEYRILPEESEEDVGDVDLVPSDVAEYLRFKSDRVIEGEEHKPS